MNAAAPGRAVVQSVRIMSLSLGIGGMAFLGTAIAGLIEQFDGYLVGWTLAIAIPVFGFAAVLAALSWLVSQLGLRIIAGVVAGSYLAGMLTLPFGALEPVDGIAQLPWLLGVSTLGTAAAAIAWRPAVAWAYLGVVLVAHGVDAAFFSSVPWQHVLGSLLGTTLMDTIFVALAIAIRRAAERLDAAAQAAVAETMHAAAADARSRERAQLEALVHDNVLVALLASARGTDSVRAASQARQALARMGAIVEGGEEDEERDGTSFAWAVQSLTTELLPDARFDYDADDTAVPGRVGRALLEASAEAMRNSARHAGEASHAVHVRSIDDLVEVTVLDDGRGFDRDAIADTRLGIRVSIEARMSAVPGGRAMIVSRPGVGTRVVLRWSRT